MFSVTPATKSLRMTNAQTISIDQFLPYPPAHVWRALTDPDLLARWLMPNDFHN